MTDEEKEKLNITINKLCEALGFTTPLNIMKAAAATTDLFYGLQKENKELEKQLECYKALESHYEEIEEDAKAIAKENEELKEKLSLAGYRVAELKNENENLNYKLKCREDELSELKAQLTLLENRVCSLKRKNANLENKAEKLKGCGNCINRGLNKDGISYPCYDCKKWNPKGKNDYWEFEK